MSLRLSLLASVLLVAAGFAHAEDAVPTGPLPRTVVPSLVSLELRLDPKQDRFSGTTRIAATVHEPTRVIWMHARDLTIGKAEALLADGRRIALAASDEHVSGVLRLSAAQVIPAGNVTLEIAYEAPFGQLQGAYKVNPDGHDYVVTQMEALGARNTFPGFDEPSFKQPWDITLIVPDGDAAVANSAETKSEPLPGGWKKVTFDRTEALPSYLIAFAVGPWDLPQGPDIAPRGARTTPIKLRGVAAKGQGGRMAYSLANTPVIVEALEDYFGTPYPFDKLDNVAAPDFAAGAMENAGLIVYRDSLMFPDETSSVRERQSFWGVSAHELAHQWFGDLVTMPWWDDLWLNEAFATWMGNKIHGQLRPEAHTDRGLLEGGLGAMAVDSLASTRRIHQPIHDFTQIQNAFDGITYQKGGAVLAMFENYVGEAQFRDGVRTYLKAHARGNATSTDLIDAIAAQSQDPAGVKAAFLSFIAQPGVPFVKVDVDCPTGKTPTLNLQQQRYLPLGSTASAAQTWGIPMCVRYADGAQVREQCDIITGAQSRLELRDAQSCPGWVMPNAHGAGYYRFALAPRLQQSLSAAFAQLDGREQRVYADSVTSAYGAGELTPSQLLAGLPQFASADVRQTVTAGMGNVDWIRQHLIDDEAERDAFMTSAAAIYRPQMDRLGLSPKPGEVDDDRLLRANLIGFMVEAKDPTVRGALGRQGREVLGLDGGGKLNAAAVPRDVRGVALAVAVEDGGLAAFDAAEKHLRASADPVLRGQLLGALGSAKAPALATRARALVLEKGLLRRNEVYAIPGNQIDEDALRPAVRQWLDAHFDELAARVAPGGANLAEPYAAHMCSLEEAALLERKFGQRLKTLEGGPLELKQAGEAIRLCAAQKQARRGQPLEFAARAAQGPTATGAR
ncbi:MAG: M1 family metallopeptidase [Lysobacter sp.]